MSHLTNYAEQHLLDAIFNGEALTFPTSIWVALHTGDPTEAATANEVSTVGTGYGRVEVNVNGGAAPTWRLAASEGGGGFAVKNLQAIVFGPALTDWGSITHTSLWDDATAGNPWYQGPLASPRTVQTGGTFTYPIDALVGMLR